MNIKTLYGVDKTGGKKVWSVWTEGAEIVVEHGKLGGKLQTKRTTCKPKNVGRANETSPEQQAESEAQSKWNKQYDKYYRETVEEAQALLTEGVMLAQDYTKKPHFLEEEFYCAPKLDGLRVKTDKVVEDILWVSRGGKNYPIPPQVKSELEILMEESGYNQLDGEGIVHGVKLQKIQSCIKKPNELTPQVVYEIFDIPMLDVVWWKRWEMLAELHELIQELDLKYVRVVWHDKITKAQLENKLKEYLSEDFEGIMMRNLGGVYEFQNKRSNDLLKYKLMFDDEAKVVGCSEDKNGQGLFTMEYKSKHNGNVVNFELSMNGSQEENTYTKLSQRIGDWVNFKYQDFTEDGVPTFARGLYFRECDSEGNPLN